MADAPRLDRRHLLKLGAATVAASALPAPRADDPFWTAVSNKPEPPTKAGENTGEKVDPMLVRVASVPTAVEGNVLPTLLEDFARTTKLRFELTTTDQVYELARLGRVDLAISHYGHKHAEDFVVEGLGEFPRTLFSNQMALIGPRSDPAGIRGLVDAAEAFRRIAHTKSPFVVNGIDGVRYLVEILWNAAGRPAREGWVIDEGRSKAEALVEAAKQNAYIFWGLTPFLRSEASAHFDLEPLVLGDPLLQRMLVSIIVKRGNVTGARALEQHLLEPATQARIREVRYPGAPAVCWVPGGRHNRTAILPRGERG